MAGVRFVTGRVGTGKTTHCYRAIVDALRADSLGQPIYWILPKQATFSAERELTCGSGLNGFARVRVVSFDGLSDDVLAECGGCAIPRIDTLGRQMLIGHLLRTRHAELTFFSGVAHQPGLAARLDATFGELERSSEEPNLLDEVIADLEHPAVGDPHLSLLRDKLRDIYLLYGAYRQIIGSDRLDPQARLTATLSSIDRCESIRGAQVYVDGFYSFTGNERQMLAAIARVAGGVDITLTIDGDSPAVRDLSRPLHKLNPFYKSEQTYRLLLDTFQREKVAVAPPFVLKTPFRFQNSASLAHLEEQFVAARPKRAKDASDIELIVAPNRRAEVDAAARAICKLLHEGQRLRDIAVLVRDLDQYHELIDASFREHDITWFVDRRRTAAHHPLLQMIRALLQIARQDWPQEAVMILLKSGLAGVTSEDADELENYVLEHRLVGPAWIDAEPWTYARRLHRDDDDAEDFGEHVRVSPDKVDATRRDFVARLRPFVTADRRRAPRPVKTIVAELYKTLEAFDVPKRIVEWMTAAQASGNFEQRDEHLQVWEELVALFDQMVDLIGAAELSLDDFAEVLETGLAQFDLAIAPPTVDQVLVGQANRTRTSPGLKSVVVVGLGEGQFPSAGREDSILADEERQTLLERHSKLDIDPGTERRLLDENFLGYLAFTRAGERLILTRSASDDAGRPIGASAFWVRIEQMFPTLKPTVIERGGESDWKNIGTPRQLVTSLMHWVRSSPLGTIADPPSVDPRPVIYNWLADYACCDDAIDTMRRRSWRALSYRNQAALSPTIVKELLSSPLAASVTRIEAFATCPFKHFARYALHLQQRQEQDVTAMDLGNVYHQILERIVRELIDQNKDWRITEPKFTDSQIKHFAREIGESLRGELMLSTARNQYLLSRIEQTLTRVVAAQQAMLRRGGFQPRAAEVEFGDNGEVPALELTTQKGNTVRLRGKIDRVDVLENAASFAVIDYKLSDRPLPLANVYHGLSLQLLTYLLVLQANGQELFGQPMTPAAAFYVKLLRKLDNVDHPDDAVARDDPVFDLRVKPRGLFDGRFFQDIDADCSGGASEVVQAYLNKGGGFGRFDSTDVASQRQFDALLNRVRERIGELADELIGGNIEVRPYRIGKVTPCPTCEYRSVCRFEPGVNRYYNLERLSRTEVFERVDGSEASHGK